ncbi:MAG: hypothetical protein CM1200mP4_1790 [Rhodospirillaceae bacterium]|nr:MAG: hypothetical protein CM1200mP4_1790 [Rhodospirillaceae bacterium]
MNRYSVYGTLWEASYNNERQGWWKRLISPLAASKDEKLISEEELRSISVKLTTAELINGAGALRDEAPAKFKLIPPKFLSRSLTCAGMFATIAPFLAHQ